MVKKKKDGTSKQRKPRKEKRVKEKHMDVLVNPKEQENKDDIQEEGELLDDMLPGEPHGDHKRGSSKRCEEERRKRKDDLDKLPNQPSSKSRNRSRIRKVSQWVFSGGPTRWVFGTVLVKFPL